MLSPKTESTVQDLIVRWDENRQEESNKTRTQASARECWVSC